MQMTYRALTEWPGEKTSPSKRKSRYEFKASWSTTLNELDRELRLLKADNVVIQAAVAPNEIRIDGMLRANASPSWPGVILSFDSPKGSLSFPCDTYAWWQHNVRAITLALAALRAVDHYGVTRRAEQYRGWDRIEHKPASANGMTAEAAASLLSRLCGDPPNTLLVSALLYKSQIRTAMAKYHPDRADGDGTLFRQLGQAKAVLDKHHGV